MPKLSRKTLLILGGGALALYALKSQSNTTGSQDQEDVSIFDELAAGAANVVATVTGTKESNFIEKMTPIAEQIRQTYGIQPLITITQSALESGWGLSGLTAKANNLFGFTGDSWATSGKSVIYMKTHEWSPLPADQIQYWSIPGDIISKEPASPSGTDLLVNRPFRAYPTWYDSVSDWAQLMKTSHYASALKAAVAGDLTGFAQAVQAAGYATEPDYASQLVSVGGEIQDIQSA